MNRRMSVLLWGGLAGGAVEVAVVALVAVFAGIGGWAVAAGVSQATFGNLLAGTDAVVAGLTIHFALSLLVVACLLPFAARVHARFGTAGVIAVSCAALSAIWALNFFVVLPRIAPEFVTIVPLWTSLLSKLAFGVVTGLVLVSPSGVNELRRRTPV